MNISLQNIDKLNAKLTVQIVKDDYNSTVTNELKKLQKQVTMKGFRPGKAPMGIVEKMHGKSVLAEQLNKIAVSSMFDYLKENKIDILGQPLSSEDTILEINEEKDKYEFSFDMGLAPEFDLKISSKDKIEKFIIETTNKEITDEIEMLRRNFGELSVVDFLKEEDIVYAYATELDEDGKALEGGIIDQEFSFTAKYIKDDKTKKALIGKKAEDVIVVSVHKLFSDNDTILSSSLGIPKEGISDLNPNFSIKIKEIKRMEMAELDQDLFDKLYGKDNVKNETELKAKVVESIGRMNEDDAQKMLNTRIMNELVEKHKLELPDAFLKRWLLKTKEEHYSPENIDEKYEKEKVALKWTLIKERVMEAHKLQVTKEQIEREAELYLIGEYQKMGYGMPSPEILQEYRPQVLQNEGLVRNLADSVANKLSLEAVKNEITIKEKKVDKDKFMEKWEELQY